MRYRRRVNYSLIAAFLLLILANGCFVLGRNLYYKNISKKNQLQIDKAISQLQYTQDMIVHDLNLLTPLLRLKNLTEPQLGQIYMLIATLHYTAGDMNAYFDTVGYALFYSERGNNKGDVVYLYSNMAKYFLEIGSEGEAFKMINKAREFDSFYDCDNVLTRIQALEVYTRYLVSIGEFEDAFKAVKKIEEDAELTAGINEFFYNSYSRASKILEAKVLYEQGKKEEAYILACDLYNKYYNEDEVVSQFNAFDFYLPLFEIKTKYALENKKYKEAIEYNELYGKYCKMFFFTAEKTNLSKELMMALPVSMVAEREKLFNELSEDASELADSLLRNYAELTNDKFLTVMDNLKITTEMDEGHKKMMQNLLLNVLIILVIVLVVYSIHSEAQLDGLTKLLNRKAMNAKVKRLVKMNKNYTAIMLDIDNFKNVNDTYGHAKGDEVLRFVASEVILHERKGIRGYRYGGEEFVIILEKYDLEKTIRLAELIRSEIAKKVWDKGFKVTASFGIGSTPNNPIEQADKNMYVAKQKGKNFTAYEKEGKQYLAERRVEIRNPIEKKN